ncbi:exported hypothetical protein [Candidatus Zixiibacteriota bacterium]|nr:exported hypothetical protein [candidate division Zixibacteria bacterium]
MKLTKIALFGLAMILLIIILSGGCTQKKAAPPPQYPGWEQYTYKHFIFHYPAGSYWGKKIDEFSDAYERFLTEDCDFLAIEIPKDTIHFYIHNDPEEGQKLTGRTLPYHEGNQIHWDRRTPFGLELARYLIDKMDIRMTDFRVLYDGLATLLDYSGSDYHHLTYSLIEIKQFIPLDSLANNESYARADSLHRNWEAASIVAFITYNFGINRLKMLWQSTATFDKSIKELFGVDIKRFQEGWLRFAEKSFKGIDIKETKLDSTKIPPQSMGTE